MRIFINILWGLVTFIVPIIQSYFSNILIDDKGNINIIPLFKNFLFWVLLSIWILGNIIYSNVTSKKEDRFLGKWAKEKHKMIKDVRQKAHQGRYIEANRTIDIIERLDHFLKEDNHEN